MTIQTNTTEQILSYGSFSIMMFKVVLTFELWASSFKCDHISESYWAVLYKGVDHFLLGVKALHSCLSIFQVSI